MNHEFLNKLHSSKHNWFEADGYQPGYSAMRSANKYINQFGLEKSGKNVPLAPELKAAIVNYFERCQIKCDENNIVVQSSIFDILSDIYKAANLQKDDKILFALPVSQYFAQQCYDADLQTVFLNTDSENGWKINPQTLEDLLQKHYIKILFLNYPNYTTGCALAKSEAAALAQIIKKQKDLLVIVDESAREIISGSHFSLAALDEIANQVITISSLQNNNLAHLNIVFACIKNKNIFSKTYRDVINIPNSTQQIAISALEFSDDNQKHLSEIIEQCRQNTTLVMDEIKNINNDLKNIFGKEVDFVKPFLKNQPISNSILLQFLGLKDATNEEGKTLKTDLNIAEFIQQQTDIAMLPGQFCLLPEEEMVLKLYLLKSQQELKAGFKKIGTALSKLNMLSRALHNAKSKHLIDDSKIHRIK